METGCVLLQTSALVHMLHSTTQQHNPCLCRNKSNSEFLMSESVRTISVAYTFKKTQNIPWPRGLWRRAASSLSTAQRNALVWHSHSFWMHSGWNNRAHDRLITRWWSQIQLQCFSAYHRHFSKENGAVFGLSRFSWSLSWGLLDFGVLNAKGLGCCSGNQWCCSVFWFTCLWNASQGDMNSLCGFTFKFTQVFMARCMSSH